MSYPMIVFSFACCIIALHPSHAMEQKNSSLNSSLQLNWKSLASVFLQKYIENDPKALEKLTAEQKSAEAWYSLPKLSGSRSISELPVRSDSWSGSISQSLVTGTQFSYGVDKTIGDDANPRQSVEVGQNLLKEGLFDLYQRSRTIKLEDRKRRLEVAIHWEESLFGALQAFLSFHTAKQSLAVAKKRLEDIQEALRHTETLVAEGVKSVADRVSREVEVLSAEESYWISQENLNLSERALRQKFHLSMTTPIQSDSKTLPANKVLDRLEEALMKNPESFADKRAQIEMSLADEEHGRNTLRRLPTLRASYGQSFREEGIESKRFALSLEWDLDAAVGRGEVFDQAQRRHIQKRTWESQRLKSAQEFDEFKRKMAHVKVLVKQEKKLLALRSKLLNYEEQRFQNGSGRILDLESRGRDVKTSEDKLSELQVERFKILLERASRSGLLETAFLHNENS